ncbi:MAG: 30S ribosomal protein S6 [Thermodesulfobacteriota bacterium]|nr:30S ribosomal protein S6 [Thermodesulfobacteriota bacterium]
MRYYEMVFIVHPSVPDDEVSAVTDKITSAINQSKGEVIHLDNWGKRRCAHKIKKSQKGNYFLLYFSGDPGVLTELDRTLRYNEKVLRYQTVIADKKTIQAVIDKQKEKESKLVDEPVTEPEPTAAEE